MIGRTLHQRSGGFTVLELAIALAITGVAVAVLMQLLSTSLITAGRADRVSEATMLARSKLAELTAVEPIKLGVRTGSGLNDLNWRVEISPAATGEESAVTKRRLLSVAVSISSRRDSAKPPILELKSLVFAATE
jgi:Tfp pilus assembly protein FimT